MWSKELGEIERCRHAYTQGILELLVTALRDAFHQWQSIVDEKVHMAVLLNHFFGKLLQRLFVSKVAYKVIALLLVDDTNRSSSLPELFSNATSDALCAICDDGYFIFEINVRFSSLNWNLSDGIADNSLQLFWCSLARVAKINFMMAAMLTDSNLVALTLGIIRHRLYGYRLIVIRTDMHTLNT